MNTQPTRADRVVLIDLRDEIAQVNASLPDTPQGGIAVLSNATAEIKVIRVYPAEVKPGDYVQRGSWRSLKVGEPPRRMGESWRVAGTSTDVGTEVVYLRDGIPLDVVRGFPVGTLPEQDDDRLALVAAAGK